VFNHREMISATSSITIDAPGARVWEALTTPELIKQWFFGVDTVTDWQVGSPLVHKSTWQGKPYEDKGTILNIKAPRLLVHTHWSALSGLADSPENYQEVSDFPPEIFPPEEREREQTLREAGWKPVEFKSRS
jgi:hypothetical protein